MSNLPTTPEKQSLIPQLNPPLPTASPSEVRAFITELLILTRNLPAQHAKEIADKWHLGTGRELTTYPPSVYADIFGSEDAWMVYKESQLFIRRNKEEKNRRQDELRKCRFAISKISLLPSSFFSFTKTHHSLTNVTGTTILAMITIEAIGIYLSLTISIYNANAKAYAITLTIFFTMFAVLYCIIAWLVASTLEDKVEGELHSGMSVGCKKCT